MNILFVCTGNTCRSPMAEAILKSLIEKDRELTGRISVSSAGISAFDGDMASPESITALNELGIELKSHRSMALTPDILTKSDLILTMTRGHKDYLISQMPVLKPKTFTLKQYALDKSLQQANESYDYSMDITDPYGMPLYVYRKCAGEIKDSIEKLIIKLKKHLR